ncbi:MAG: hemerythrin domain-containing protein [Betaproteobacteria bacterium]|nr:hemerythrin domain-containing protein [Betaproteobacteria bacterium]
MSGVPKAVPDFSRPLEALKTCHKRIKSECEKLRELAAHLRDQGSDPQVRQTAAAVMRYFDTAARYHHEDEEEDLLPRMMAAATVGRGSRLTRMVADIANEHRVMDREWTEMRAVLQEISAGENVALDTLDVDRFIKLYQSHIAVEEASVYPLAKMLLSSEDLAAIGASMAQRRGNSSC